ncbi:MAG: NAD+ synthase [Candidatus Cloacimonetes bacterium]|nr:NAD+ synthase [Candidatus Cloacimonadota bacterium]
MRKMDVMLEEQRTCTFIRQYLKQSGLSHLILGLSGGIDSAVSAALCVRALGAELVRCVMLPYRTSNPSSLADAREMADRLGAQYQVIDITPMVDPYLDKYAPEANNLRRGNLMARIRMSVLYDLSARYNALVVGTSNRSELLTGYFTQHGDGASAFEPIGHLYKTEVKELAPHLGVTKAIINKKPSADLWQGQTDEEEMGISYAELDEILWLLTENDPSLMKIDNGIALNKIDKVKKMISQTQYKRRLPAMIGEIDC